MSRKLIVCGGKKEGNPNYLQRKRTTKPEEDDSLLLLLELSFSFDFVSWSPFLIVGSTASGLSLLFLGRFLLLLHPILLYSPQPIKIQQEVLKSSMTIEIKNCNIRQRCKEN
jgi:hypothetical protein